MKIKKIKKSSKYLNLLFCKSANKSLRLILCTPLIIATRRSNPLWIRKCILGWILIRYRFDFTKYLSRLPIFSSILWVLCNLQVLGRPKGQLVSEWNFRVFKSPRKPTKFLTDFCPNFIEKQKSVKNLVGFLGDLKKNKN